MLSTGSKVVRWLELTILCIGSIYCFILLLFTFYKYYLVTFKSSVSDKVKINKYILYIALFGVIFYNIAIITLFIAEIWYSSQSWEGAPNILVSHAWAFANSLTYLLFFRRIYDVFSNTIYKPRNITYIICIILIFLYCCSENIVGITQTLKTINYINITQEFEIINFCLILNAITDFLITVILLYLFISKLIKITILTATTDIDTINDDYSLGNKQNKFINVVTKQTILTLFGTLTTQIVSFWGISVSIINWSDNPNINLLYIMQHCLVIWLAIDLCINCTVIILSFEFNKIYYQKICYLCHICTNKCCAKITKTKIIKHAYRKKHTITININNKNINDKNIPLLNQDKNDDNML